MSAGNTMKATPEAGKHDWSRFDAMTDAQRHGAAVFDPDAKPLTPEDFKQQKRTPRVKVIRRALGVSQEDFAARFHIPLGTLRDWEQGRKVPDAAARAYLIVIGAIRPASTIQPSMRPRRRLRLFRQCSEAPNEARPRDSPAWAT